MSNLLKFGIPKGSLEDATVDLFKQAGWTVSISSRSYFPDHRRRRDEMQPDPPAGDGAATSSAAPSTSASPAATGCAENESDVVEVCEMVYSKVSRRPVRWVLVVAQDSKVQKPEDLHGGDHLHRTGRLHQALLCRAQHPGDRRVLLGGDRGQGGRGAVRRHRRGDRNRLDHHAPTTCASSAT